MMWSYATLPDGTQIAYSDLQDDGTLRIAVERARDWNFDSARCVMPAYRWSHVDGFSDVEIAKLDAFLRNNAPLIFELAEAPYDERLTA
ncbi:MAG: hypothetical protein Q4B35_02095 [Slackia sp.]|nr:hypothetical protein [Slackia sp.]